MLFSLRCYLHLASPQLFLFQLPLLLQLHSYSGLLPSSPKLFNGQFFLLPHRFLHLLRPLYPVFSFSKSIHGRCLTSDLPIWLHLFLPQRFLNFKKFYTTKQYNTPIFVKIVRWVEGVIIDNGLCNMPFCGHPINMRI